MRNLLVFVISLSLSTVAYSQEKVKVVPEKVDSNKLVPEKIEVQKVNPKVNPDVDLRVEPQRRIVEPQRQRVEPQRRTVEPQRRTVEQRTTSVPTFYNNYLRRQARPDEVQIWERKNLSPLRIQSGILGSDEYFHRFHDNRREFIIGLFLD